MDRLIAQYGLALVFANVLLEQLGLPIPAVPALVVAGALSAAGEFSPLAVFGVAFVACMMGDAVWYLAGRRYGRRVMTLLCRLSLSPDSCVRQTEFRFERWGKLTLVLSKFFPGLGVVIWAGAAIAAGMAFHAQINEFIARLEGLGTLAAAAIGVLLGGYIALKWWERRRFYKLLRIARIGVDELRALIKGDKRPVVVDVRSSSARDLDPRFIPGALAMDVADVERRLDQLPADREIIFYCTCPNEASAAQVAKKLLGLGYTRVRPLQGGLDAWIAAGYEIEHRAASSADATSVRARSSG